MANWNGGVIGAANIPTTTVASGMWPLAEVNQYIGSGDWPFLEAVDPYFQDNVLLLHGDGTSGAQNNTFLDSSTNNFTITRSGNTTQGTFSPFSKPEGGWGNYFDGTGDYLTLPTSTALQPEAGNYTIELFYNSLVQAAAGDNYRVIFSYGTGLRVFFYNSSGIDVWEGASNKVRAASVSALNQWNHLAISRSGSTTYVFYNGTLLSSFASTTNLGGTLEIGRDGALPTFYGYISNFRMIKGTALYTSAFTPPTAPLTAVSGTSLLTCQSNRFKDNSTNNFAITRNGDVKVTPFSPFPLTVAYSPSVNGGSGYFDGAGDFIRTTSTIGVANTDFAIGLWFYPLSSSVVGLFDSGPGVVNCFRNFAANVIADQNTTPSVSFAGAYQVSAWNWMCITKSGTSFTVYINGTSVGTGTCSNPMAESNFTVGTINSGGDGSYNGYISDFMFVNNSATELSVPTAPLEPISGTSFLVNFTNAGISDNTSFNNLETVGNVAISTAEKKYGTGSISIPATTDGAKVISGVSLTGDFTIEFWSKSTITGGERFIIIQGINAVNGFLITASQNTIRWRSNGTTDIQYVFPTNNTGWYHVAIVRNGTATNNVTVYYNGTSVVSGTYTNQILPTAGALYVGPASQISASFAGTGYIDDLRITNGIARYTSNFTPPIAAFPNIGE